MSEFRTSPLPAIGWRLLLFFYFGFAIVCLGIAIFQEDKDLTALIVSILAGAIILQCLRKGIIGIWGNDINYIDHPFTYWSVVSLQLLILIFSFALGIR